MTKTGLACEGQDSSWIELRGCRKRKEASLTRVIVGDFAYVNDLMAYGIDHIVGAQVAGIGIWAYDHVPLSCMSHVKVYLSWQREVPMHYRPSR